MDKNSFVEKLKNNRIYQYIIIAIIIVITIILCSIIFNKKSVKNDDYVSNLENKLEKTLSSIEGAGKVDVVITVSGDVKNEIAYTTVTNNSGTSSTITSTPLLINGEVVVLQELNPEIIGVLIVADGANDLAVLSKIQYATTTVLGVNVNDVEILKRK